MSALELKWILFALLGGTSCGLAGFLLVCMNLPFMGVCLAHAALAGAVLSFFLGVPPLPPALACSLATAVILGPLADKTRTHANTIMSFLFSLTLGLAFLGIGLMQDRRSEVLGLMWGNLLLVRWKDLGPLIVALVAPLAALLVLRREIKAVLFDREIAAASGIPAALVFYFLLALCGFTVTVNLNIVGGLMLYSLLTNPAAAALQVTQRYRYAVTLSATLGAASAVGGVLLSLGLDWPAGACIVLVSAVIYIAAAAAAWAGRARRSA